MPKVVECPGKRCGTSDMDGVIIHINNFIRKQEDPSAIKTARELKKVLAESGLTPDDDEIFYNFDGQYKVKYTENDIAQVATFWCPWQGGISWKIEDDK